MEGEKLTNICREKELANGQFHGRQHKMEHSETKIQGLTELASGSEMKSRGRELLKIVNRREGRKSQE